MWYNSLPEHQMALITPGCAPFQVSIRHSFRQIGWTYKLDILAPDRQVTAFQLQIPTENRCCSRGVQLQIPVENRPAAVGFSISCCSAGSAPAPVPVENRCCSCRLIYPYGESLPQL